MKNSTKSVLAIAMSAAALVTFGVLAPRIASATVTACSSDQWGGCGTYCSQQEGKNHSCCGVDGQATICICFTDPVDCSFLFS